MATRTDVRFKSGDDECAGWLYLPEQARDEAKLPAIAMAHGLGAIKELYLAPTAEVIADAGIAVLVFDYRYYGESGGSPREQVVPRDQIEDYRNALSWLSLRPEVDADRLGVWGTSFSGGHVLHLAAYDKRVKAVVSQVAGLDLWANAKRVLPPEVFEANLIMAGAERVRRYQGGEPVYIPLASKTGEPGLQPDTETHDWLTASKDKVAPGFNNRVTLDSIERILEHAPALSIDRIAPTPLLMIVATGDKWTPPDLIRAAFDRAGEPKRFLEIEGGHYTVYDGPGQPIAAKAAADWFTAHLGGAESRARELTDVA
jgi:hypothetical protein